MTTDQTRRRPPKKAEGQDATLHPDGGQIEGTQTDGPVVDEANKAVVDPVPAIEYGDALLYVRGGDKACWVYAATPDDAMSLFKEYAEVPGTVESADGPVAGDRVLIAHVDGDARRLLLAPFQQIVRTVRAK